MTCPTPPFPGRAGSQRTQTRQPVGEFARRLKCKPSRTAGTSPGPFLLLQTQPSAHGGSVRAPTRRPATAIAPGAKMCDRNNRRIVGRPRYVCPQGRLRNKTTRVRERCDFAQAASPATGSARHKDPFCAAAMPRRRLQKWPHRWRTGISQKQKGVLHPGQRCRRATCQPNRDFTAVHRHRAPHARNRAPHGSIDETICWPRHCRLYPTRHGADDGT